MDVIENYHESIPDNQNIMALPGLEDIDSIISPGHIKMLISRALNRGVSFDEINLGLAQTIKENDLDLSLFTIDIPNYETLENETGFIAGLELPSEVDAKYLDILTERGLIRLAKTDKERYYALELDDEIAEDLTDRLEDAGDVLQTYLRKKLPNHTVDMDNLTVTIDLQNDNNKNKLNIPAEIQSDDEFGLAA